MNRINLGQTWIIPYNKLGNFYWNSPYNMIFNTSLLNHFLYEINFELRCVK